MLCVIWCIKTKEFCVKKKEKKTKQNSFRGKKLIQKLMGEKLQGKKSKKDKFQCEMFFIQKSARHYKRDSTPTHIEDNT